MFELGAQIIEIPLKMMENEQGDADDSVGLARLTSKMCRAISIWAPIPPTRLVRQTLSSALIYRKLAIWPLRVVRMSCSHLCASQVDLN